MNTAYERQMHGGYWQNHYWAGQNIQNLGKPIEDIVARGELEKVRNVRGKIKKQVLDALTPYS